MRIKGFIPGIIYGIGFITIVISIRSYLVNEPGQSAVKNIEVIISIAIGVLTSAAIYFSAKKNNIKDDQRQVDLSSNWRNAEIENMSQWLKQHKNETNVGSYKAFIENILERSRNEGNSKPTPEEDLRNLMDASVNGLISEVNKSRVYAMINLAIGGGTSVGAITLLSFYLFSYSNVVTKPSDLYSFIPRIALTIFIELFSFFFLRLYRRNLDDIKYLTNEITNVRLKIIALLASFKDGQGTTTATVIKEFAKTERNFSLKKGESTVEIEKMKIESKEDGKMFDKFGDYLNQLKAVNQGH